MPLSDTYLSVIVPTYNEAERIGKTLERMNHYLSHAGFTYEIVVVLDGPTDASLDLVQQLAHENSRLKIVHRTDNRGKGYTVREGMLKASGRIRLFSDADNSTDIAHFDKMKPLFDQGFDVVIASRNPKDEPQAEQTVPQAVYKRVIGQIGNRIVQAMAVPGIWDTQCGFKAFTAEAAERIFAQTTVERWGFDIEVLALARALNYRIGIIPAHWINDDRSHVRLFDYVRVLADTFHVRRNFLTGKYQV